MEANSRPRAGDMIEDSREKNPRLPTGRAEHREAGMHRLFLTIFGN